MPFGGCALHPRWRRVWCFIAGAGRSTMLCALFVLVDRPLFLCIAPVGLLEAPRWRPYATCHINPSEASVPLWRSNTYERPGLRSASFAGRFARSPLRVYVGFLLQACTK